MSELVNTPYYMRTRGKALSELVDDEEFQQDLVDFFRSGRYNYSADKIKEYKPSELAEEFFTHMRWQASNETTAIRDLQFATQDTLNDPDIQRGKDAFGRLIAAWDTSEGEGASASAAKDYILGSVFTPSTALSLLSVGVGSVPAKAAAQASKFGAQIALREALKAGLRRQTVGRAIGVGAARAAAVEGTLGGGMEYVNQLTREETIDDYAVDMADVAAVGGASALLGGAIGGVAGGLLQASNKNKGAKLMEQMFTETMRRQAVSQRAVASAVASSLDSEALDVALENVTDYAAMLAEASTGKRYDPRDPLNKDMVALGESVKKAVIEGYTEDDLPAFMQLGIAPDRLQKVAAASVEIVNKLGIKPEDLRTTRITQLIADRNDGETILNDVKERLGLSADDISAVFVAEFSRAGKTLQVASQLAKAVKGTPTEKKLRLEAAKKDYEQSLLAIRHLFNKNLSTVSDDQLRTLASRGANSNSTIYNFLNDLDKFGVAMLTVQPATTMANIAFSFGRVGIDMMDTVFTNIIRDTARLKWENPLRGSFDMLRFMVADREAAQVLRIAFTGTKQSNKLFIDASRAENQNRSNSILGRVGTWFNKLNQLADNVFKNAMFATSISRSLREFNDKKVGTDIEEFIMNGGLYSDMPEDAVKKAVDDALRFTFQKGYEEKDTLFAKAANRVIRTHQEVPFLVSSVLGVPFPRYVANHLEFFHDYMPGVAAITIARELATGQRVAGKDMATRVARQLSGLGIFSAIYGLRAMQGPTTEIGKFIDEEGNTQDTNRLLGPLLPMYQFADTLYRWKNDMPLGGLTYNFKEIEETLIGTGLAFEGTGFISSFQQLSNAFEVGAGAEELSNRFADVFTRFTYPLAAFRDMAGQFEARLAIKPYTRSTSGDTINLLDMIEISTEPLQRLSRFIPDIPSMQWFESINGETDLPIWSPFNNRPVQEISPLRKQLTGIRTDVPMSAAQKELARLRIAEYTLVPRKANASVDYAVKASLARKDMYDLPGQLEDFINSPVYQRLSDSEKSIALKSKIADAIKEATDSVKQGFEALYHEQPNLAIGYLTNDFLIKTKQMRRIYSTEAINARVNAFFSAPDANTYLDASGDDIAERAKRIQQLLDMYQSMEQTQKKIVE